MTWRFVATGAFLLVAISGCGSGGQLDTASQRAWDDLRWLMTALEAYATDNDGSYVPAQKPREGDVSLLDSQLEWYYDNTFPKRASATRLDPWGRPYRFVFSNTGKLYALYSLGSDGKLESSAATILRRVQSDAITAEDLAKREASKNLVVVSGTVVLAPPDVLQQLRPAEQARCSSAGASCSSRDAVKLGARQTARPPASERPAVGCELKSGVTCQDVVP